MPTLPPVPNTPLRDDPTQDSIWKRWLQLLKASYGLLGTVTSVSGSGGTTGLTLTGGPITTSGTLTLGGTLIAANGGTGIASYSVGDLLYADTTTTLAKLPDVATKQVLVSGGVNTAPAWSPNLTLSGDLGIEGNTTLGNASGDSITINAGSCTLSNDYTITRAVGTDAAGVTTHQTNNTTLVGNALGTTNARAVLITLNASGANNLFETTTLRVANTFSGTGTNSEATGISYAVTVSNTGNCTTINGNASSIALTNTGSVSTANNYIAEAPTLSSTGSITTNYGYRSVDMGHATLVTNAIGFHSDDFTASLTLTAGFRSAMTSGTGKWGFLDAGGANNAFAGNVRIGSNVAPTVALDVTGAVAVSGNANFNGNTTLGDASGDSITINAGSCSLANDYTVTRAVGVDAAGVTTHQTNTTTLSGDAGGTTNARANLVTMTTSGGNALTGATLYRTNLTHSGSATLTTQTGWSNVNVVSSTGNATNATGFAQAFSLTNSGSITTAGNFLAQAPTLSSTGSITTHQGFRSGNLGHATLVTNAIGFDCDDMTASVTLTAAFRSQMSAGTGKKGFYAVGTADNFFEGIIQIGATGSAANNAQTVTVGNVGPGAAGISIQSWQKVKDSAGNTRYIPLFG